MRIFKFFVHVLRIILLIRIIATMLVKGNNELVFGKQKPWHHSRDIALNKVALTDNTSPIFASFYFSTPGTYSSAITIPAGVYSIFVTVAGAAGGYDYTNAYAACGGSGAVVAATMSVQPGDQYTIIVGGAGNYRFGFNFGRLYGGYNNAIAVTGSNEGAGGGGGSEIVSVSTGIRLVVAGGGGGGGGDNSCSEPSTGGVGGTPDGGSPTVGCAGDIEFPAGATQYNGGNGGFRPSSGKIGSSGDLQYGGNGDRLFGGSGGGGYYGGGGGASSGGAGGSSYCSSNVCTTVDYSTDCGSKTFCCYRDGYVSVSYNAGPTSRPSKRPSMGPTKQPLMYPTRQPVVHPSEQPTAQPKLSPTRQPTVQPSSRPSNPSSEPSTQPSVKPSIQPSLQPSTSPIKLPTARPSKQPTRQPSYHPTLIPSRQPSFSPTNQPTSQPLNQPSHLPSHQPSQQPTFQPTRTPSRLPSIQPIPKPSSQPSNDPSINPTAIPSTNPTKIPTRQPSGMPTIQPRLSPSTVPSLQPSAQPSSQPSVRPYDHPTTQPSFQPSGQPLEAPSIQPSQLPSIRPTHCPSRQPSSQPFSNPSWQPINTPSMLPSSQPHVLPSRVPSNQPSSEPSLQPHHHPSIQPSANPSKQPQREPTMQPSINPSVQPTLNPSRNPSSFPTIQPFVKPSRCPSKQPTILPSAQPTLRPSSQPFCRPTKCPSEKPSQNPTKQPSKQPSKHPTIYPSSQPIRFPSVQPFQRPSQQPNIYPSAQPLIFPSDRPSTQPSRQPTTQPRNKPSGQPTRFPTGLPSIQPHENPSLQPRAVPSQQPILKPSEQPLENPSSQPHQKPSIIPSHQPSLQPLTRPSQQPQRRPSDTPTCQPTNQPTQTPSRQPSSRPFINPSKQPIRTPSRVPSLQPHVLPTQRPSILPSDQPSSQPADSPSYQPTSVPFVQPSELPLGCPTTKPSLPPSSQPQNLPSLRPSSQPLTHPSKQPARVPSRQPSILPSSQPFDIPSFQPLLSPSSQPHLLPSAQPVLSPSTQPTNQPSYSPTFQPFVQPTAQPIVQPSRQPLVVPSSIPTLYPSIRPHSKPSQFPSSQPLDFPSAQPSRFPTALPSRLPSNQPMSSPSQNPSDIPSLQPSSQPSVVPTMKPSSKPIARPIAKPTSQPLSRPSAGPSMKPILRPHSGPSCQPSYNPTVQPLLNPSLQPSRQPSSQPTAKPSVGPTVSPSSRPTIDGRKCSQTTYYQPANNTCKPCPLNSKYYPSNRLTCGCNPGYSQSGFASTLTCTQCSIGQYATNFSKTCIDCPQGSFSSIAGSGIFTLCPVGYYAPVAGSSSCLPCPVGFYNALLGQALCTPCSGGQITPGVGSISATFCLSPLPNFTMGFIALAFVLVISVKYIFYGNLSKTAFLRKERYVVPMAEMCMETNNVLKERIRKQPIKRSTMRSTTKALLFLVFSILFICVYVLAFYIALLYHIFFTSMILWRSMVVSFKLPPLLDIISASVRALAAAIGVPVWFFEYLLYPGIIAIKFLSTFQLNLSSLNVTCNGAKAPIELFINFFILAVYIIFIKSEYFLLWSVCFKGLNQSFINSNLIKGKIFTNLNVLYCVVVMGLFAVNPLQSFLRYSLTFASITTFFSENGMHPLSPACDNVTGAPMFDSILGITSTIMVWLLIMPVIYLLSEVIVPGKMHVRDRKVQPSENANESPEQQAEKYHWFNFWPVKVHSIRSPAEIENEDDDSSSSNDSHDQDSVTETKETLIARLRRMCRPNFDCKPPTHSVRYGLTKYVKDTLLTFASLDVWVFNCFAWLWVKYLSKVNKREMSKLRRRVSSIAVADSIIAFQNKSIAPHTAGLQLEDIITTLISYGEVSTEQEEKILAKWEQKKLIQLPTYAKLCDDVKLELVTILKGYHHRLPHTAIAMVVASSGIGHFFTDEGRRCWSIVSRKYYVFLQVCVGMWTEEAFEAFELESISHLMLTTEEDEGITMLLTFIIGPRALLFQVLQFGTMFSACVLSLSGAPLMVFSESLRKKNLPDMLFSVKRAHDLAMQREIRQRSGLTEDYFQSYTWIINIRSLVIIATESRLVTFTVHIIILAIIFMFTLFAGETISIIVVLFLVLVPYAVAKSLLFIVYFGKSIDMQDVDFKALFGILSLKYVQQFIREGHFREKKEVISADPFAEEILDFTKVHEDDNSVVEGNINDDEEEGGGDDSSSCYDSCSTLLEEKSSGGEESILSGHFSIAHSAQKSDKSFLSDSHYSTPTGSNQSSDDKHGSDKEFDFMGNETGELESQCGIDFSATLNNSSIMEAGFSELGEDAISPATPVELDGRTASVLTHETEIKLSDIPLMIAQLLKTALNKVNSQAKSDMSGPLRVIDLDDTDSQVRSAEAATLMDIVVDDTNSLDGSGEVDSVRECAINDTGSQVESDVAASLKEILIHDTGSEVGSESMIEILVSTNVDFGLRDSLHESDISDSDSDSKDDDYTNRGFDDIGSDDSVSLNDVFEDTIEYDSDSLSDYGSSGGSSDIDGN